MKPLQSQAPRCNGRYPAARARRLGIGGAWVARWTAQEPLRPRFQDLGL